MSETANEFWDRVAPGLAWPSTLGDALAEVFTEEEIRSILFGERLEGEV